MIRTRPHRSRAVRALAAGAIALCAVTTVSGSPAAAATPALTGVVDDGGLRLDWASVEGAEAYLVIDERTGEVLSRASSPRYTRAVEADESYSLLVFADTGTRASAIGKVLAIVPADDSPLPSTAAVTTAASTTLTWAESLPAEAWQVTVDGLTPVSAMGGAASFPLGLDSESALELNGSAVVDGEPLVLTSGLALAPPRFSNADVGGDAQAGDLIAASTPVTNSTQVVYETYIPPPYVNAPDTGSPLDCESGDGHDYWYNGNDRDFAFDSGNYKTRASATYAWIPAATYTARGVQATKRYIRTSSGTMVYESTRTAPRDGVVIEPMSNDGRSARLHIAHSVGNPYCSSANNIDYFNMQEVHQSGGYYFTGNHDQMPDHQLVMFLNQSDGSRILRAVFDHDTVDETCLSRFNPFCSKRSYQYAR